MGRGILVLAITAAIAAGIYFSQSRGWRARRAPAGFIESFEMAPIVDGAMPRGLPPGERSLATDRSSTRFWRRPYAEATFTLSTRLPAEAVEPFVRAVRDSIEERLAGARATVRGIRLANWPDDSLGPARPDRPMSLTVPYATRRRAGWVAVRAGHSGDELTMWVSVFEGPKPTD